MWKPAQTDEEKTKTEKAQEAQAKAIGSQEAEITTDEVTFQSLRSEIPGLYMKKIKGLSFDERKELDVKLGVKAYKYVCKMNQDELATLKSRLLA